MPIKPYQSNAGFHYGHIIVITSTLILVGALGVHYAFGVFFKPLLAEFGWSRAVTSGAVSLSWIIQGLSSIVMGTLNDRRGPRVVVTLCGLLLGAGYLLMSQVNSLWQLYLFYGVLVGAGLGGFYVPLTSTVARWFTTGRSVMTGIVVAGIGIGTLIAPLAANWLISYFDWRFSYLILGGAVLIIIVIAAQFLKREPGILQRFHKEIPAVVNARKGLILSAAIRTHQFWILFSLFFCFGICLYVVLVHIVPFATDINLTPATAAGLLSAIGGVSIVGKIMFGRIGDIIGGRAVYSICFTIMVVSFILLILVKANWALYFFAVAFGLAYSGCAAVQSPLIATYFGLRAHGSIFGTANSAFTVGGAVGPLMAGYIFDTSGSYQWAFIISAILAAIGLILTLVLKPLPEHKFSTLKHTEGK